MSDSLPDQRFFNLQSQFCSIFSNPTRIKIFYVIQDGEKTVTEIAETIGYAIPNISQHLRLLKDKGAVISQKRGREVYYRISNDKFLKACYLIREGILEELHKRSDILEPTLSSSETE